MPGFANDAAYNSIMWSDNLDFSGNVIPGRAITADGQLLIGSTVAPNIRTGTLTAGSGISITNGSGSITVAVSGSSVGQTITGDIGGALSPVAGNWFILASATGSGTSPAQTSGSGNTLAIQIQRSQAIASTNASNVGLAAFKSADFSVDANGFVSASATGLLKTLTGDSGGARPPTANNINILGGTVVAGTTPIAVAGASSTLTINLQRSQAISAADSTKIGLCNFNSNDFSVDANGFVSIITGGFQWSDTSGTVTAVAENGYFITGTCTSTLPAAPNEGDTVKYIVDTTNLLTITGNTGQKIRIGTTLSAAAGTAVNTQRGDAITLVYRTTGTTWFAEQNPVGGWNVT